MKFTFQKRAELSMSTIVMAIIALLVLIVLATMIIRNLGGTSDQFNKCETLGGSCSDDCQEQFGPNSISRADWFCYSGSSKTPSDQKCCITK